MNEQYTSGQHIVWHDDVIVKREFEIIFKKVKSRKTSNLQRVAIKWSPVKIM